MRIRGAAEHNLRSIDVDLPHGRLIGISGVSGSGKSSLAFDTIYAEARRRYLMSLPIPAAASLVGKARAPRARLIDGLAPAVAIDQGRGGRQNARSTAATLTGVHDYLRLFFARLGQARCLVCGAPVQTHRFETVFETAAGLPQETKLVVLAPARPREQESISGLLERVGRNGYSRIRIDGRIVLLEEVDAVQPELTATGKDRARARGAKLEVVIDRLVVREENTTRLKGSLQAAIDIGEGQVTLLPVGSGVSGEELAPASFSVKPACSRCGSPFKAITTSLFSFNSSQGACADCRGLGSEPGLEYDRVFAGGSLSIEEGLGPLWRNFGRADFHRRLTEMCDKEGIDSEVPVAELSSVDRLKRIWSGRSRQIGIRRLLERVAAVASGDELVWFEDRLTDVPCSGCSGSRLNREALAVELPGGETIASLTARPVGEALDVLRRICFEGPQRAMGETIRAQIERQMERIASLGLGYLALDRPVQSLSSGEFQRLRLAAALGSRMTQMLYVLDEPSVGLHARDTDRLAVELTQMRDDGNTVIVVEHDLELLKKVDYLVDMGPGAGVEGGRVEACGTPDEVAESCSSTGAYVAAASRRLCARRARQIGEHGWLTLEKARGHNLRDVTLQIPLATFVSITGVSGSGKSSLIHKTLYPALAAQLHKAETRPLAFAGCAGVDQIDRVVAVDQKPIGRSSRSNAATYTGLFGPLRSLFAELPDSRVRGYGPSHFSFNSTVGACEECSGTGCRDDGTGSGLLEDLQIRCHACSGTRYRSDILEIRYRDHSISDVLDLSVRQAFDLFEPIPDIARRLDTLRELGLGYLHLGQPASSLSGGEAQRVKLSTELSRSRREGRTLYILDEPTTGLHLKDVQYLVDLLQKFVDSGNTVVVVEHNVDLIAASDHVVDLGPEAGAAGGEIVVAGSPADVAACEHSHTGAFLARLFGEGSH